MSLRSVVAFALIAVVVPGCGGETAPNRSAEDLPGPVSETRSAILAAADAGDYKQLRSVLDPKVFLSDFGFGTDPTARWQKLGLQPLETMDVVLRMPNTVRETNEGMLYQWPRFTADSSAEDLTDNERDRLLRFMTEDELKRAFLPELGYTGPHLGILADGTWWFFILKGG